ncbi:SDR family NAD(P)-dependent oxidoreductase [Streptomyces nodosus]
MARNVVISGGGTGIGLATARVFAADGDRVLLLGRRAEVLERAEVPGALTHAADLSDPHAVHGVARHVADTFGTVDVLVNAAGEAMGPAPATGAEDRLEAVARTWTAAFGRNTLTAVLLTEAVRDRLASPGGRVLFLSSVAALCGFGSGAYGASKAALHPYAFGLARELGPRGVTVNVVAPGSAEDTGFSGAGTDPARRDRPAAGTSTGRAGTPGDIAQTLHWLASPGARHITAQVIRVDGGAEQER